MGDEIKLEDVVKHISDKNVIGFVIDIYDNKVKIRTKLGDKTYSKDFLEKCDIEESSKFSKEIEDYKKQKNRQIPQANPDLILREFNEFIGETSKKYPEGTQKFLVFWEEIKNIIGDKPGITWTMRKKKDSEGKGSKYPGLIILDPNTPKHSRVIYLFFDDDKIQIAIVKKYVDGYKSLFPAKNRVNNSCDSTYIKWYELKDKKVNYLNIIKELYKLI